MRSSDVGRSTTHGAAAVLIGLVSGCAQLPNPWSDDLRAMETVAPVSVQVARASSAEGARPERGFAPVAIAPINGPVPHGPLYWHDPFEDQGSNDGQFCWTGEDYLAAYFGIVHNFVKTVFWPLNALVTNPGTMMGSDGISEPDWLGWYSDSESLSKGKTVPTPPAPSEP